MANEFAARTSVEQVEEGAELAPKFDAYGLIPAVTTDAATGELLMVGYMNAEALRKTIETGEAHYWSRSRQVLWHKGATSGLVQKVVELMIDDDQDCVWFKVGVAGSGASCHVGYRTCFYRRIPLGKGDKRLEFTEKEKVFDPKVVGLDEILRVFWEDHDPTQGMRQGNDVGTQYRSAIYTADDAQAAEAKTSLHAVSPP